jgi:rod shape-determining protein MreD
MISPFFILSVYIAAVLESRLTDVWSVAGVTPDLMALVTLVWLTSSTHRSAVLVSALVGLACDLGQSTLVGPGAASFAITGFCIRKLQQRFQLEQRPTRVWIIALSVISIELMRSLAARFAGESVLPLLTLMNCSVLTGVYTAGTAVPILMMLSWQAERKTKSLAAE